jgi:hypothetical protein
VVGGGGGRIIQLKSLNLDVTQGKREGLVPSLEGTQDRSQEPIKNANRTLIPLSGPALNSLQYTPPLLHSSSLHLFSSFLFNLFFSLFSVPSFRFLCILPLLILMSYFCSFFACLPFCLLSYSCSCSLFVCPVILHAPLPNFFLPGSHFLPLPRPFSLLSLAFLSVYNLSYPLLTRLPASLSPSFSMSLAFLSHPPFSPVTCLPASLSPFLTCHSPNYPSLTLSPLLHVFPVTLSPFLTCHSRLPTSLSPGGGPPPPPAAPERPRVGWR